MIYLIIVVLGLKKLAHPNKFFRFTAIERLTFFKKIFSTFLRLGCIGESRFLIENEFPFTNIQIRYDTNFCIQ